MCRSEVGTLLFVTLVYPPKIQKTFLDILRLSLCLKLDKMLTLQMYRIKNFGGLNFLFNSIHYESATLVASPSHQ